MMGYNIMDDAREFALFSAISDSVYAWWCCACVCAAVHGERVNGTAYAYGDGSIICARRIAPPAHEVYYF